MSRITRVSASGQRAHIADGYERLESLTMAVDGPALRWTERRLVVRSRQLVRAGETGAARAVDPGAGRGGRAQPAGAG